MTECIYRLEISVWNVHNDPVDGTLLALNHCPYCGSNGYSFYVAEQFTRCHNCGCNFRFKAVDVTPVHTPIPLPVPAPEPKLRTLWEKFYDNKAEAVQ